jgi:hypothetical protein
MDNSTIGGKGVDKPPNCVCDKGKFCKYHYSALYYERNKKDILMKQKQKYKETQQKKNIWSLSVGRFSPFSETANPSPELVIFFGKD